MKKILLSLLTGITFFGAFGQAASVPYSNGFENAADPGDGFTLNNFGLIYGGNSAVFANVGQGFIYTNTGTSPANSWAYTRGIHLDEGESVGFSFFIWFVGENDDIASVDVTVGTTASSGTQTILQSFPSIAISGDYSEKIVTYTAPSTGTYYFGIHNVSPAGTATGYLFVDTISIYDVELSVDNFVSKQFDVYPNPVNDVVNITNADNIFIDTVTIVDMNGRVVKSKNYNNVSGVSMNVNDLSPGLYLMQIATEQGTAIKKIIKR